MNNKKFEVGMKKAKEGFEKAKAGVESAIGKAQNSEAVKKMTPGQKLFTLGSSILLVIIVIGLFGRLLFTPSLSIWGVVEAPTTELSFKVEGIVSQVPISEKQVISQDALIARINGDLFLADWENAKNQAMDANFELLRMDNSFKPDEIAVAEAKLKAAESVAAAAEAVYQLAQKYEGEFGTLASAGTISENHLEASRKALSDAENRLKAAKDNIDEAKRELDIISQGFSDEEKLEAKNNAEAAAVKAETAKSALENASLVAPFDAYVIRLDVKEGEPAATDKIVCQLADMAKVYVRSEVGASDARRIKPGAQVYIAFPEFVGEEFTGQVESVSEPQGSKCEVKVAFNVPNEKFIPGLETVVLFND